jgi:hypothetical protein
LLTPIINVWVYDGEKMGVISGGYKQAKQAMTNWGHHYYSTLIASNPKIRPLHRPILSARGTLILRIALRGERGVSHETALVPVALEQV